MGAGFQAIAGALHSSECEAGRWRLCAEERHNLTWL